MIEMYAGLGIVLIVALLLGMAPAIHHHKVSFKWFLSVMVLGVIGLAMIQGLPLDVSDLVNI